MTGRTFIIDPAVQGRVSVVTAAAALRVRIFRAVPVRRCAPTASSRCRCAGGAFRIQPVAGAAATAPVGGGRRNAGGLRHRDLPGPPYRAGAGGGEPCGRWSAATARSPPAATRSSSPTSPTMSRRDPPGAGADRRRDSSRDAGRRPQNAGAREIAAALTELAPDGVSVVPVDSSNAIALRGDAAAVAHSVRIAEDLDRRARDRQRDPGRLPRACRRRAIAAGAADAARPDRRPSRRRGRRSRGRQPGTTGSTSGAAAPPRTMPGTSRARAGRRAAAAAPSGAQQTVGQRNAVVTRFEGANAIVISAAPDVQRTLGEVIRQLDVRRQQVLVEAIIVEIGDTAAQQLGVQLFLSGPARLEHPVRDHQLFQHHAQYRHASPARSRRASWAARRPRSTPAPARRRPRRPAPAPT